MLLQSLHYLTLDGQIHIRCRYIYEGTLSSAQFVRLFGTNFSLEIPPKSLSIGILS